MAYDAATGQVVLFSGNDFSGSDTWTWNGSSWTKVCPSASCTVSPGARYEGSMAYDPAIGKLVLVGGRNSSSPYYDTWAFDGAKWTQLCPSTTCTQPLDGAGGTAMAYDATSGQLVLFGGYTSTYTDAFVNTTWTFDGTNWVKACPSSTCTTSPSARAWAAMSYDPTLSGDVLVGGYNNSVYSEDTWMWAGSRWQQLCPTASCSSGPAFGEAPGLVFDPGAGDLLGYSTIGYGDAYLSAWDGTTSTQLCPGSNCAIAPPARTFASMAYDAATGTTVLFGGRSNSTGNLLSDTWTLKTTPPDQTPPTTTDDAPTGWSSSSVTVHLTATDNPGGSGVAATFYSIDGGASVRGTSLTIPAPPDGSNDGSHNVAFYSVDAAGNQEQTEYASVEIDTQPPTISATAAPAPNGAGWNNTPVTVTFTCSDNGSGIAVCPPPVVLGDGANQTVRGTAIDNAGNQASTLISGLNVDATPPTLAGSATTAANANGWYEGNVTIDWTCGDAISGIAGTCPNGSVLTGEGPAVTDTESVADVAGNTTTATSAPVQIDRTPPVTNATAPGGWSNSHVPVTLSASDTLSGVDQTFYQLDGGATQTGTSLIVSGDGIHTLAFWSTDLAGNIEPAHTIAVKIDSSAPSISHTLTPTPNAYGWNDQPVAVSFTCTDPLSGIASCTGSQTVTSEGAAQTVIGRAVDNAGNSASDTATVSTDFTPPSIAASLDRSPNGAGWFNADVGVAFSCSDSLSGVASCPAALTLHEGANQTATGTATDAAGNSASATLSGINIDATPPVISFQGNSGSYTVDQQVNITCSVGDALSGVASSNCQGASGPAYSFGLGTTVITGSATDVAGNPGTASDSFTVVATTAGIEALIRQLVATTDAQNELIDKLDYITTAPTPPAKNGRLGAFDNQVDRLTPSDMTPAAAALLKQLASAL